MTDTTGNALLREGAAGLDLAAARTRHAAASPRCIWPRASSRCYPTEYGPFAISLSLLTLAVHQLPGAAVFCRGRVSPRRCRWLLFVVLIALSRLKFDVTQLTLTFLDFLLDRPRHVFVPAVGIPRLKMAAAARRARWRCRCSG